MRNYDHVLTGYGIDVGYWIDAQSEPEIIIVLEDSIKIKISCWLNHKEDSGANAIEASYELIITFENAIGYQMLG